MFEGYSEPARRAVFFARYEASQFCSTTIETGHLLLGLIREDKALIRRFLPDPLAIENLRKQIKEQLEIGETISASIHLPLSDECKRILVYTKEEAEPTGSNRIDTGHLLLGILKEESCVAAKVLTGLGLELKAVREEVLRRPPLTARNLARALGISLEHSSLAGTSLPEAGVVPNIDTAKQIAEAVWIPRFSALPDDRILAVHAELKFDVWIVTGTHTRGDDQTSLAAFIQKKDGIILRLHPEKIDS
jgi:hypothetical protein